MYRNKLYLLIILVLFASCKRNKTRKIYFTDDIRLKTTPVKDQGESDVCWIYAMLATIETEHIMRSDSVNLSDAYAVRMLLHERMHDYCRSGGRHEITTRGVCSMLVNLIGRHGIMAYDAYHVKEPFNLKDVREKLTNHADMLIKQRADKSRIDVLTNDFLDETIGPKTLRVFMFGAEYTPLEFAHSVCLPNEYSALTSFTHHPFGSRFVLEIPDNHDKDAFLNVPLNELIERMEDAIRKGHPVCWEGDVSEEGFSFENGTAILHDNDIAVTQQSRQEEFEEGATTDDHCMEIMGLAHDKEGRKYFICKNSWGKNNPYKGFMYMSYDYVMLKTIAVFIPQY